ncbi:MAG: hypothetical protein A2309_11435, partial [Bacteroidetes bacterium RIFOXYB2_FULL_35_7]
MIAEPHKIKTVRNIKFLSFLDRVDALQDANYNTFRVKSDKVIFDMTSQGTSAVSHDQYSGLYIGDETYAGSRNFEYLKDCVLRIFGHKDVCPTHNIKGSHKLIVATMVKGGDVILSNSHSPSELIKDKCASIEYFSDKVHKVYPGNMDLGKLEARLKEGIHVPFIYMELFASGYRPVSMENMKAVYALAEKYKTVFVLNVSQAISNAQYLRKNEASLNAKSLHELLKEMGTSAHVIVLDAGQDPRSNTGGLIGSNVSELYNKYMNEVVVYEGLHTYGGMAGRTMEVFARGMDEMIKEEQAEWIDVQIEKLSSLLKNIPHYKGADGIYIKSDEFLPQCKQYAPFTLAAAMYLKAGVRTFLQNRWCPECKLLPLQIPRLSFTMDQIAQIAESINQLYAERNKITELVLTNTPVWSDEAEFKWKRPLMNGYKFSCEAYTIQHFEYFGTCSREERLKQMNEAGFNTFLLPNKYIGIDLLTDSGTCSQTTTAWSKYILSSETQASSISYDELVKELQGVTGYKYIVPTHQGRAAEHIMSQCLIKGGFVPGNMYFTTTKLHQELAGGTFVDIIVDEAHVAQSNFLWKGNVDVRKIDVIVQKHGADSIPYISFEFNVNLAGGQPVSMDNAREVYEYCEKHNIPVM